MGICISFNKNKNKSKKDEVNKNIKIKLNDNRKSDLEKDSKINENINIEKEKTKNKFSENNIIILEQNSYSVTGKNSIENTVENNINKNKNENSIIFSISDEFNSNPDSKRNIPYSPHLFEIANDRDRTNDNNTIYNNESLISDYQELTNRTSDITCVFCSSIFHSIREYDKHFNICNEKNNNINNNRISNNANANSIFRPGSNLPALLGLTEIDEQKEYINWKYNTEKRIWENKGKIYITKDEINLIDKISINEIKEEKNFYIKRIWLQKKINNFMLDNTRNNPPLVINRKNILIETFNQFLTNKDLNFYRKLHIYFIDEMAYDDGGVERDWYSGLFNEIFSAKNNYFREIKEKSEAKGTYFILSQTGKKCDENREQYFSFFGRLFAKAILDKILIPYELNPIILKYLLFSNYNDDNIDNIDEEKNIFNINDIKYFDYEIYNSLVKLLNTNLANNLYFYFVWNINHEEIELIDGGSNILVNNENKNLFINKIIELICFKSIKDELQAFKNGFISIIPLNFIKIFTTEEFSFILYGQKEINLKDWKMNTIYKKGITEKNEVVQFFWEILEELKNEQLLLFFKFCTGSTRVPVDGFSALPGPKNKIVKFCIELLNNKDENDKSHKLITAQTCFNTIILPQYKTKDEMRKAINIILESDTNYFGLE